MPPPDAELTKSVPKLVAGCDVAKLPIGALEGFVLSRIDGNVTVAEIATMTGMGAEDVGKILDKLWDLGAVDIPGRERPPPPAPPPPPAVAKPLPKATYDPAELEEANDLDGEVRKRVLDLFYVLDDIDHYQLLGLPRDADRKAVKSAYYAMAATLHTDRYFGKNLGTYKQKMEQLFGRVTLAHDTLANKQKRAEYDEYVVERDRTRAFEQLLAAVESDPKEAAPEALQALAGNKAPSPPPPAPAPAPPAPAPSAGAETTSSNPPARPPSSGSMPAAGRTPEEERARREALARRLGGARASTARMAAVKPNVSVAPNPNATADPRLAADALKRRYEDNIEHAKRTQARRFVEQAEASIQANDYVSAANAYRLALKYTTDPAVQQAYDECNKRARDLMAEAYLKQAKYEEGAQKWREAAISYAKAHEGRPDDPDIAERVAECLRREGRDLHRAARFAELAVQKNQNKALFRVTLGHVYLDAGLFLRARSELEQAVKLAPADAKAKELLAQVRKMVS